MPFAKKIAEEGGIDERENLTGSMVGDILFGAVTSIIEASPWGLVAGIIPTVVDAIKWS